MRVVINVLGTMQAIIGEASVVPTAPKQRQVLALLALNAGKMVTTSALIDEIWDDRPPGLPLASLQTYIMQVRRRLGQALLGTEGRSAKDVLVSNPGGYTLDVPCGGIDAVRYEQLVLTGRAAMNSR